MTKKATANGGSRGATEQVETEYDGTFEELVQHVAAELPHFDPELGLAPMPVRVRRSGVYVRRTGHLPLSPVPGSMQHLASMAPPLIEPHAPMAGAHLPTADAMVTEASMASAEGALAAEDSALALIREELRVDVDGLFPTMTVSGTIVRLFGGNLTWIARVGWDATAGAYVGPISYRDGITSLQPHTDVRVKLTGSWIVGAMKAHVTYTGGGHATATRTYDYEQSHFRAVGIEFDCAADATAVTSYNLGAHPNRPPDLPATTLTIEDAFTRQGIRMTNTGAGDIIPVAESGADLKWSDVEMHDAMQQHWSKWADVPQWQVWTLFAGQHDMGHSLGGIMFDDIGTAQRQGCAIFSSSFISDPPPAGDPNPAAFVQRMRFWTAVHEIGHTFNLAHAWQKSLGTPWIPLADEPEARSFMNYPYNVSGGTNSFFANFYYRFSENELLFLRHAPMRFVEQGNAAWFDHHGFEQARLASSTALALTLRVNRGSNRFEALEPVVAELKLKNTSNVPIVVDKHLLDSEDVTIVIARDKAAARHWLPYARHCYRAEPQILQPGESLYSSCFLSAGRNGWDLAEPGSYQVYAAIRTPAGHVLSAPMRVRIDPPASREEERIAPDIFTDEVGRVLAFNGSRVLDGANDILQEVAQRLPERNIALHAAAALGQMMATPGRVLVNDASADRQFAMCEPSPTEAAPLIYQAYHDLDAAADTFGHIRVTRQLEGLATALADTDERAGAADLLNQLASTLDGRQVLPAVVDHVRRRARKLGNA